jgi:hypothetical protein
MEELVMAQARHDEAFGEIYRHRLETIYELPEKERGEAFATAYSTLFEEHQLGKPLNLFVAEFPTLQNLEEVLVFSAAGPREESAELSQDQTKMGIKLRAERLREPEQLKPFLRHELMHISDMLDPNFSYRYEPSERIKEHLIPRRYQVLWDTYIDGRLERMETKETTSREERQREFERLFSFLPRRQRATAFQGLWDAQEMTHTQLLEIAEEPTKLALLTAGAERVTLTPISGTFCPLCQFPTFEWTNPEPGMTTSIQEDFPTWTREEGICNRCYEYYQIRCEREGATL